jgi:integrase
MAVQHYIKAGKSNRFLAPLWDRWERVLVRDITPGIVRTAARDIYPKAGPATWNRQVITPARAVINHAADLGLCSPIRVKRFKEPKAERRATERAWHDRFVANAPPALAALCLFMFQSGARVGEATALEWKDVNLQEGWARFGRTKNGHPHKVHLTVEMVALLANLPKGRKVFGFATRHCVYRPWKVTCRRAGIAPLTPHEAGRHSFATAAARHGIDPATIARLGNWHSPRFVMDTYVQPRDGREVIEEVFGTPASQAGGKLRKGLGK